MATKNLAFSVLPDKLAVYRFDPQVAIPDLSAASSFFSITRTQDELSVVCAENDLGPEVQCEKGWRCIKLHGPFNFSETGILSSMVHPLAKAAVPVFAISTFDTDYLLIKATDLKTALKVLTREGLKIRASNLMKR